MRLKADLTLLLVSIIWGSAFVAQRVAGQMCSVYLFNWACYLLAAIVVLPFAIRATRNANSTYKLLWAQRRTPPADAALILSLESIFAVLSGWLLLDERLAVIQVLGCVPTFIAVFLSQFKEWNLQGKIDSTHPVEGR